MKLGVGSGVLIAVLALGGVWSLAGGQSRSVESVASYGPGQGSVSGTGSSAAGSRSGKPQPYTMEITETREQVFPGAGGEAHLGFAHVHRLARTRKERE